MLSSLCRPMFLNFFSLLLSLLPGSLCRYYFFLIIPRPPPPLPWNFNIKYILLIYLCTLYKHDIGCSHHLRGRLFYFVLSLPLPGFLLIFQVLRLNVISQTPQNRPGTHVIWFPLKFLWKVIIDWAGSMSLLHSFYYDSKAHHIGCHMVDTQIAD